MILGCDPGSREGAMASLSVVGPGVYDLHAVASWKQTRRKHEPYTLKVKHGGRVHETRHTDLWRAIEGATRALRGTGTMHHATVEWPLYGRRGGKQRSAASIVSLASSAGAAAALMVSGTYAAPLHTPSPGEWRGVVLRLSANTAGPAAKARALRAVLGRDHSDRYPVPWRILGADGLDLTHHEAEAACVALLPMMGDRP